MSADVSALVDALVERSQGRLAARDRLDALDEHASTPTSATLARHDPAIGQGLVEEALDDVLSVLAVPANRHALRALSGGARVEGLEALMRAGLVIDSWTGGAPRASAVGSRLLALLDEVCSAAALRFQRALEGQRGD